MTSRIESDMLQSSSSRLDSASFITSSAVNLTASIAENDLGCSYAFGVYNHKESDSDTFSVQTNRLATKRNVENGHNNEERDCMHYVDPEEPFCRVKLGSLIKLKDSTRKLLYLLEEIQGKTCAKISLPNSSYLSELIKPIPSASALSSITDLAGTKDIKKLESEAKTLDGNLLEGDEDNCSIYKRLTRKCHCLNQPEYNDFIIHFNESTKYYTSTIGEIIKNLRILKKFLYIGGDYAKNALTFLNEGLAYSTHMEKVDITNGCTHADICNVFDDQSIVIVCISWPCNDIYGDSITQALAASFLNKLAQLEEGRRYLKFSSKITVDIKKIIRKNATKLELDTLESLNSTLNLLHPPLMQNTNVTYYCKPNDEDFGIKTVTALVKYRQYMIFEEVFTHLNLMHTSSNSDSGKRELKSFLPTLLVLFKSMLIEYDNSEINIIITKILNNVVSRNMVKAEKLPKTIVMAETATEPIKMKNEMNQIPPRKSIKKFIKSKIVVNMAPNKFRQSSRLKGSWITPPKTSAFSKEPNIIIVPVEENKRTLHKAIYF